MGFVFEMYLGLVQFAEALNEAELVRVDQDISDCWILQQRLDRTIAGHLIDDLVGKYFKFALIERNLFSADVSPHIGGNLLDQLLPWELFQQGKIELVDDPRMQLELLVQKGGTARDQIHVDSFRLAVAVYGGCRLRPIGYALHCPKQEAHVISPTPRPSKVIALDVLRRPHAG